MLPTWRRSSRFRGGGSGGGSWKSVGSGHWNEGSRNTVKVSTVHRTVCMLGKERVWKRMKERLIERKASITDDTNWKRRCLAMFPLRLSGAPCYCALWDPLPALKTDLFRPCLEHRPLSEYGTTYFYNVLVLGMWWYPLLWVHSTITTPIVVALYLLFVPLFSVWCTTLKQNGWRCVWRVLVYVRWPVMGTRDSLTFWIQRSHWH